MPENIPFIPSIIANAENVALAIKNWREKPPQKPTRFNDLTEALINSSLLPPNRPEAIASVLDACQKSQGEIPLVLHAISCLNFIRTEAGARIVKIDTKTRRWKVFVQQELPSFLEMFSANGIRPILGFCVSDLADFIDDKQLGVKIIPQNVQAQHEDLDKLALSLRKKWGFMAPDIRVLQHSQLFNSGPLKQHFDEMFNGPTLTEDLVKTFRHWLMINAVSPETDPFLSTASEAEAVWQIFASGVLYAADAAASPAVMQKIFPAENINQTLMLNLFPDFKADAIIQKVFIDSLIKPEQQPVIISPFPNAGRWQSDPSEAMVFPQNLQFDWKRPILELITDLMKISRSEARSLIIQGAVRINEVKFTPVNPAIDTLPSGAVSLWVGKKNRWEVRNEMA